jgi:hypothetical protein
MPGSALALALARLPGKGLVGLTFHDRFSNEYDPALARSFRSGLERVQKL